MVEVENLELDLDLDEDELDEDSSTLADGMLFDYITGELIKDSPKEQVRQRIIRALVQEYAISVDDVKTEFTIPVGKKRKKVSVAVFKAGKDHTLDHLRRIVICEKEPSNGKNGTKMRDHEQAQKDLDLLQELMSQAPNCQWGLWTNGLEFFFLEKEITRFDVKFKPMGDWPLGGESQSLQDVYSDARMRKATPEMLRIAFRRCHNFIHGNEGMPKDAAFWQFLYLIFSKMHDERSNNGGRRFWAGPTEQFTEQGRKVIRDRVEPLFNEVKKQYPKIFTGDEKLSLSDRALAFMVSELARYDFTRSTVDAKGAAYQEIVGTNLRGDKGQYFTPRSVISMAIAMLDPKPQEKFLDPASGTGGFLVEAVSHVLARIREELRLQRGTPVLEADPEVLRQIKAYATNKLFGADFDPFLVKAAQMNVHLASDGEPNVFYVNSLELPGGYLNGVESANKLIPFGTIDVIATNPPFGSKIPVDETRILERYDLGHVWKKLDDGTYRMEAKLQKSVAPEILFIERVVNLLKPGTGRAAIVLPNGLLSNASDTYIRQWILRHTQVLASVDLPMETFIPEADVNILTSVLFLRRRSEAEIRARDLGGGDKNQTVFFAVAERVGYDRRGLPLYVRAPDGKLLLQERHRTEQVHVGGKLVDKEFVRMEPEIDNDLVRIAEAWRKFQASGQALISGGA